MHLDQVDYLSRDKCGSWLLVYKHEIDLHSWAKLLHIVSLVTQVNGLYKLHMSAIVDSTKLLVMYIVRRVCVV